MKMKNAAALAAALGAVILAGCGQKPAAREPIVLTVWHVYGGQTDSPLNDRIDEFNRTVGEAEGIRVSVTSVSNTNTIHEAVLAAAHGDPGAADLPDLFISYPKTVAALGDASILADYNDYFTKDELSAYVQAFLEEGVIDGRQVIFPLAKSTEILFVNKTLFDRFAADTGVSMEDLSTWEGIFGMAEDYTAWTDAQTPDTPGDGKAFFVHDYPFNYFQVGVESLGGAFFDGQGGLVMDANFDRVWDAVGRAAVKGGIWLKEGYATDPLRTGEAIVSVASSASVLYYQDMVTYADNTSEPVEIVSLPCPTFAGGEKLVMQRGAGFCLTKSTQEREKAACLFLKWLTEPERNTGFALDAGYLPVTEKALAESLAQQLGSVTDPKYKSLYEAVLAMQGDYAFYVPPQLAEYLSLEDTLEGSWRTFLGTAHQMWLEAQAAGATPEELDGLAAQLTADFGQDIKLTMRGEPVG